MLVRLLNNADLYL